MDRKTVQKVSDRGKIVLRSLLLLLCAAALVELCLFNFRSIQSLFYEEHSWDEYTVDYSGANIYQDGIIAIQGEMAEISVSDIDLEVKNVRLELEPLDSIDLFYKESGVCHAEILVLDEGSSEYMYSLIADWPILSENHASQYKWVSMMGNLQRMDIRVYMPTGHLFKVNGITFNATKPLDFSPVRFLTVWVVFLLCYGLRRHSDWWKEDCVRFTYGKKAVLGLIFLLFFGISFFLMTSNPMVMNQSYNPYQELAWALDEGQVSLLEAPSQALMEMGDPYDFMKREVEQIEHKADFAYYNGNYYVYQGILPCLLFYLPVYHLTGLNMPNSIPVFFCCFFFTLGFCCLMRQIIIRYFPQTPFALFVMITLTVLFGCQMPYFLTQPDSYILTVMCAVALTVWGIYFWISAKMIGGGGYSKGRIIAGSFCMALVAAVRPTLLLYSILAFVIFGRAWLTDREGFDKKSRITMMALFAIPYAVVAVPVMYYNVIRFDSPFEFGVQYNLTAYNIRHLHFSLDRIYYAVKEYFFRLPPSNFFYPFIDTFRSYYNTEGHAAVFFEGIFHSGLIPFNLFLLAATVIVEKRREFRKKGIYAFCLCLPLIGIFLMMLDVELTSDIAYRYQADFSFAIFIAAWAGILWMQEQFDGKESHRAFKKILMTTVFLSIAMNSVFWFTSSYNYPMLYGNTDLYYDIFYRFNFW